MKALLCTLLILAQTISGQNPDPAKIYDLNWNAKHGKRYYESRVESSHTVTKNAVDGHSMIDNTEPKGGDPSLTESTTKTTRKVMKIEPVQ